MAIAYLGYDTSGGYDDPHTDATITIPANATFALIGLHFWGNVSVSSLTLDGQAATLIHTHVYNGSIEETDLYYVTGFATGASKTLYADWSAAVSEGCLYSVIFFSGVDSVEAHDPQETASAGQTLTTGAMTSSADHMVLAFATGYTQAPTMTGGGQSSILSGGPERMAYYGVGYKTGTGATDTATCSTMTTGSLIGVTLRPAGTPPTVTTTAISAITATTATSGGTITAYGSATPTAYGVCWNTTGTPTTADSHTHDE